MSCTDDCWDKWQTATAAAYQAHTARLLACTTNQCRIDSVEQLKADLNQAALDLAECILNCFLSEP